MNHIKQGSKNIWLPYTQMKNHLPQLEVATAKGSKIFLKNGDVLIDGIASWWSAAHGYNHPHIIREITKQAKILPHIMLAGLANEQTYKLAHRLCKFSNMDYVFFSDSGSTAVEVAMKIAWQFHVNRGEKNKIKFISFRNSYHGDTTGAMSLADPADSMHEKFAKILMQNFSRDLPQNENELDEFENFALKNKKEIAGIFIEPLIQCAGGMKFHSPKILKKIFDIAKKHKIIFIADECATGFYRTGKRFAVDHAKIKPDILILGKALTGGVMTLAATLVSKEIYEEFLGDDLNSALMHGPTFMGNPLAASAANASLDLFEKNDYEKKIKKDEKFLRENLEKYRGNKIVKDVRVLGMIGVLECDINRNDVLRLRKNFVEQGIFLRPFGDVIYLMPALNIGREELGKLSNFKNLP